MKSYQIWTRTYILFDLALQLKSFTFALGSNLKSGNDKVIYKLCIDDLWYKWVEFASTEMFSRFKVEGSAAEGMEEWQRLIPFMVKSFQLARELIHKNLLSDQDSLDQICSFGIFIPLQFLLPFGDVAAKWRLRCTLQAARLLSMLRKRQIQSSNVAAEVPFNISAPAQVPNVSFLSPSKHVEISILQAVAVLATQIGEDLVALRAL